MDTHKIEGEEVIERKVKSTGNGAHVYVPKEWLDSDVKVVRQQTQLIECDVCDDISTDCEEWVWIDNSGGLYFQICARCRLEIKHSSDGECSICRENKKWSKSEGFEAFGGDKERYEGCDECRQRVGYGNPSDTQPAWVE